MSDKARPVEHSGSIVDDFIGGAYAECTCGWTGDERPTAEAAGDDLQEHYRLVAVS